MPFDVDRDKYIKTCFLTGTISLVNDNAEVLHKVKVGKLALQAISFPLDEKSLGSFVLCATAPYSGRLYVIDVYTSSVDFTDQQENQYRFIKVGNGTAEIRVDGNGRILLSVDSEEASDITLSVSNKNRDGVVKIQSTGSVLIDAPKIYHNEKAEEAMLLGNKTVDLIDELLDVLNQESAGPYTLRSKQKYLDIKQKTEELKSKISFLK